METYCIIQVGGKQFCVKEIFAKAVTVGAICLLRLYKLPISKMDGFKLIAKVNCKLNPQK
jgi:hypothetical protein